MSRYSSSTLTPSVTPAPPCICTAASMTCCAASVAWSLAIAAARRLSVAADILLPGGAVDQQRRGIDRERHVGELGLSHRIVGERAAAEPAALGEAQRLVERAPREAQRRRADRHPEQVQGLHADAEALARLADDRVGGNADIVVVQPRERVRRDDFDPLGDCRRRRPGR